MRLPRFGHYFTNFYTLSMTTLIVIPTAHISMQINRKERKKTSAPKLQLLAIYGKIL